MIKVLPLLAALAVLGLGACKKQREVVVPDAGVEDLAFADSTFGVRLQLEPAWKKSPAAAPSPGGVRVLLDARRLPSPKAFMVAPRLVVTSEPSTVERAHQARQRALDELRGMADQGQLKILRTSSGERSIGDESVAELELSYEVKAGPELTRTVDQRSLFVLRRLWDGSRAIVTVTTTCLADDLTMMVTELERMFAGVELMASEPESGDGGVSVRGAAP